MDGYGYADPLQLPTGASVFNYLQETEYAIRLKVRGVLNKDNDMSRIEGTCKRDRLRMLATE